MNNLDYKKLQEIQKMNRLKESEDCLVCEVVVPTKFKESPMSIIQGEGDIIEVAMLIKCLEDITEDLKKNFPETKVVLPVLRKTGGMKEAYKEIAMDL